MRASSDLIGLIYDTALDRSAWPRLLSRLSDEVGGGPAVFLVQNQLTMRADAMSARLDAGALPAFNDYYAARNPLTAKNSMAPLRSGILPINTDETIVERARLLRTEFYNEFLAPNDMSSVLMAAVGHQGQNLATLNLARTAKAPRFEAKDIQELSTLVPHLARSFRLGLLLGEAQQISGALLAHLNSSPYGLFLIDRDGLVRKANTVAETMLGDGLSVINANLTAAWPDANRRLHLAIATAASPAKNSRAGATLSLPRISSKRPYAALITPLQPDSLPGIHWGPTALVCIVDPDAGVALPKQRLIDLYGLTPAEASVALLLLAGHDVKSLARELRISPHTVRVHLARIMDKTQTSRQAELIRLMMQVQ